MTLRVYLGILRQQWTTVATTLLLATIGAALFSASRTPLYSATARVLVQRTPSLAPGQPTGAPAEREVLTEGEILRGEPVAKVVAGRLRLSTPVDDLLGQISVSPVPQTNVLLVTARALEPQLAKDLADTFTEEYINLRREQSVAVAEEFAIELTRRLNQNRRRVQELGGLLSSFEATDPRARSVQSERDQELAAVASLQAQIDELIEQGPLSREPGQVVQSAPLPVAASTPNYVQSIVLGLLLAVPVAVGLALLRDSLDSRLKGIVDTEEVTGLDVIGVLPFDRRARDDPTWLPLRDDSSSRASEAFRALQVSVDRQHSAALTRVVLVTSAGRQEGKSTVAANVALAFAQAGRSTVLVSADLRNPVLAEMFAVPDTPGVADYAREGALTDHSILVHPGLWLVPSSVAPDALSASRVMTPALVDRIHQAVREPQVVVLDTPAVLLSAEAATLAAAATDVVLVVYAGRSDGEAARRAADQLRRAGAPPAGVVLIAPRSLEPRRPVPEEPPTTQYRTPGSTVPTLRLR